MGGAKRSGHFFFFLNGDIFYCAFGSKCANFQQKSEKSCEMSKTFDREVYVVKKEEYFNQGGFFM